MSDKASLYAELTKSEEQEDGSLLVTGTVSDDSIDIDKQIADGDWLKGAVPNWFTTGGNVREMHQPIAAGIAEEYAEKAGKHTIVARVVDENSIRKVKAGVLKGFSIGIRNPRVVVDKAATGGRIVGGSIIEVSLVDRPANPACTLTLAKAATPGTQVMARDYDPETRLVKVEELKETPWDDSDQTFPHAEGNVDALPTPAATDPAHADQGVGPSVEGAGVGSPDEPLEQVKTALALADAMDEEHLLLFKREFDAKQRKRLAGTGAAMSGGGFPIVNAEDLENAIRAIGRAKDPAAAKAHIKARAKALGLSAKIPDTWKAALADLVKSTDTADETRHDPATLKQVRDGILQCLIAEAQEMIGGEDETYDLTTLTQTLALFVQWWRHESWEGEAPSVVEDVDKAAKPDTLIVVPEAPVTTEPEQDTIAKNATPDAVKSMVAEAVKSAEDALLLKFQEVMAPFTARLEKVEGMAAPGGPARTRTKAAGIASQAGDALRREIAELRMTHAACEDAGLRQGYGELILQKTATLNALTAAATTQL